MSKIVFEKKRSVFYIVAICVLAALLVLFIVLYSVAVSNQNEMKVNLENVYKRNFSELVDNVNNTEIKLSKVLVTNYDSYAKKLLNEISKNSLSASNNLSVLPTNIGGIDDTIKFINQVSGYTQSLAEKLEKGEHISQSEIETLNEIKDAFSQLKNEINSLSNDIYTGNILSESKKIDGDFNNFTLKLQNVKPSDVDYPTMIYDGPFSDSTLNSEIKNLNKEQVSKVEAEQKLLEMLKNVSTNDINFVNETNGKFETFDFMIDINDNCSLYVQITKNGGELLTMTSCDFGNEQNYSKEDAIEKAINFCSTLNIKNLECVWSDVVGNNAYINLAPLQNGVVLYPDLIKVKIDLATNEIIGYEAKAYFTNHTQRNIPSALVTEAQARSVVPNKYAKKSTRLCIAPLEYNKEILCYETVCNYGGSTYYVYVNALNMQIENILKVVETDNGNLLM